MSFNPTEFGQRIKQLRTLLNVTQEELAEELNISFEHMNKIERGRHGCSLDLVLELSSFFGVSTDYLLTGHDCDITVVKARLQGVLADLAIIIHSMG